MADKEIRIGDIVSGDVPNPDLRLAIDGSGNVIVEAPNGTFGDGTENADFAEYIADALSLDNTATSPTSDGELRLNGNTVEIMSDGVVRSLSDISEHPRRRVHFHDTTYGTDTSDRDRVLYIPTFDDADRQYEIIGSWSDERGTTLVEGDFKHVIADGKSNSGNTLGDSTTYDWRPNQDFEFTSTTSLPYTLTAGNGIWVGVQNDTGADVTCTWGFEYRRVD